MGFHRWEDIKRRRHPSLSEQLRADVEHFFAAGWDALAVRYAKLAADARELEDRCHRAELVAALTSEEG